MIKAVIVGINEYPQSPLSGCVNDATDVVTFLTARLGYAPHEVLQLVDGEATKESIVAALRDMIAAGAPGDHLLFHFSGHGSQIASSDLDEPDGLDEVLCPADFDWDVPRTALTDNELRTILESVPADTAMTAVIDACHSGDFIRMLPSSSMRPRFLPPPESVRKRSGLHRRTVGPRALAALNGAVVSACRSTEVAIDTTFEGRPNGAFTYYWLKALQAQGQSLASHVSETTASLAAFNMHPVLDGSITLHNASFAVRPAPTTRLGGPQVTGSPQLLPIAKPRAVGQPIDIGYAGEHGFGGGLFGASYNRNANFEMPDGYVRDHIQVVLDPPGSGNVYFTRWLSDDETRGSFEFHVGVPAFWGGRATFSMIARPVVTINQPEVRDLQGPASTPSSASAPTMGRSQPTEGARRALPEGEPTLRN